MSGNLLDTNAVIALQAGDAGMLKFLAENAVLVPSIVIGELYYGAYNSGQVDANISVMDEFAASNKVLAPDAITANIMGVFDINSKSKDAPFLRTIFGLRRLQCSMV